MLTGRMTTKPATKKTVKRKPPAKSASARTPKPNGEATKKPRVYAISFASVYPLYLEKAQKKGRTKEEVDEVLGWLTGYRGQALKRVIETKVDLETFFARAPRMNPKAALITGVVCGVRVEDLIDPLMQKIRYMDKLIDELAKGKKMESILRQ